MRAIECIKCGAELSAVRRHEYGGTWFCETCMPPIALAVGETASFEMIEDFDIVSVSPWNYEDID